MEKYNLETRKELFDICVKEIEIIGKINYGYEYYKENKKINEDNHDEIEKDVSGLQLQLIKIQKSVDFNYIDVLFLFNIINSSSEDMYIQIANFTATNDYEKLGLAQLYIQLNGYSELLNKGVGISFEFIIDYLGDEFKETYEKNRK